LTSIWNRNM